MSQRSRLLCFAFFLSQLLSFAGAAQAQVPFTILEKDPYHLRSLDAWGTEHYIPIENELNERIHLVAHINGDSTFRLSHTQFSFPHDSSRWALGVHYIGNPGDTSHAWVVIMHPGTGHKDSVEVWGYTLQGVEQNNSWNVYHYGGYFGSYYWMKDSLRVLVQNRGASSFQMTATILSGAYGISLGSSNAIFIEPNAYGAFRFDFDSQNHDSAYAQVLFSGGGVVDTIRLHARRLGDTLYWHWRKDYFNVPAGDTLCQTITINNTTSEDASISSFLFTKSDKFYINAGPSLPHVIDAGDSLELSVCYVPGFANSAASDYLRITFQFPGQSPRTSGIYLYGSSLECVVDADLSDLDFGEVDSGTTVYRSVWIRNRHSMSSYIDSVSFGGDRRFSTDAPFPVLIPPLDSARIDIRFVAGDGADSAGYAVFYTNCGNIYTDLHASVIDNDSAIALFGDQTHTLSFATDSSVTYRFFNDQQDSIRIMSVSLAQGVHFAIADIQPATPEFGLAPNDEMLITVELIGTPGNHDDTLIIVTETGIIALRFPIDANIPSGAVEVSKEIVDVSVSPNPSFGAVTIDVKGGRVTSIEVLDILGTLIAKLGPNDFAWDGSNAPSSTYFVRVLGRDAQGRPFIVTRRVVIE